ncbi:hypothetical protein G1C97_1412 [Bifidobacterium sp. DSM 109959]|uniref:Uncharacterized protein n=1 Tax=Bifidobacterium olomucense TaxID=2675324 RepID=A0A7Y0HVN6_9BIFI|nr:hypothetical protein [Bifidobacterium sp. DSM 109959]
MYGHEDCYVGRALERLTVTTMMLCRDSAPVVVLEKKRPAPAGLFVCAPMGEVKIWGYRAIGFYGVLDRSARPRLRVVKLLPVDRVGLGRAEAASPRLWMALAEAARASKASGIKDGFPRSASVTVRVIRTAARASSTASVKYCFMHRACVTHAGNVSWMAPFRRTRRVGERHEVLHPSPRECGCEAHPNRCWSRIRVRYPRIWGVNGA